MCASEQRSGEASTLGAMDKASGAQIGLDCFPGRGISETGFDAILASAKRVGGMTYEHGLISFCSINARALPSCARRIPSTIPCDDDRPGQLRQQAQQAPEAVLAFPERVGRQTLSSAGGRLSRFSSGACGGLASRFT